MEKPCEQCGDKYAIMHKETGSYLCAECAGELGIWNTTSDHKCALCFNPYCILYEGSYLCKVCIWTKGERAACSECKAPGESFCHGRRNCNTTWCNACVPEHQKLPACLKCAKK